MTKINAYGLINSGTPVSDLSQLPDFEVSKMAKKPFGRNEAKKVEASPARPAARPRAKSTPVATKPSIVRKDVGPSSLWEVIKRWFR